MPSSDVPDLSRFAQQAAPILTDRDRTDAEARAGLRCAGCGERLTDQVGVRAWMLLVPAVDEHGVSGLVARQVVTCADSECPAAVELWEHAVAVCDLPGWTFLDDVRTRAQA
jgi:hypothetical protein